MKRCLSTAHHREEIVPQPQPINTVHFEQLVQQLQKKERVVLITGAGMDQLHAI